jgi:small subunit ribosomal protein S11
MAGTKSKSASKKKSVETVKKSVSKVASRAAKKKTRKVQYGIVHIQASFNNTLITVTDTQGNALSQASSGSEGFKGSRKSTPFAAQVATEKVCKIVKENFGIISVAVYVKGPGPGREGVLKTIVAMGIKITEIRDDTGIPHNGPRPPKKRRV